MNYLKKSILFSNFTGFTVGPAHRSAQAGAQAGTVAEQAGLRAGPDRVLGRAQARGCRPSGRPRPGPGRGGIGGIRPQGRPRPVSRPARERGDSAVLARTRSTVRGRTSERGERGKGPARRGCSPRALWCRRRGRRWFVGGLFVRRNRVGDGDEFERRRRSGGPQFNSSGVEVERTRAELGVVVDLLLGRSGGGDEHGSGGGGVELVRGGVGSRGSRWACEGWRAWPRVHAPRAVEAVGTRRRAGGRAARWSGASWRARSLQKGEDEKAKSPLQVFYYHH